MPKPKSQRPFNFGRVFFPDPPSPVPSEVRLQPLGNHVGNVRRLVKGSSRVSVISFNDISADNGSELSLGSER